MTTIRVGGYSRPACRANTDLDAVLAVAVGLARAEHKRVLVKPDGAGRWQAWIGRMEAGRRVHRGAINSAGYRRDLRTEGGEVYLIRAPQGCGEASAERVHPA